MSMAKEIRSKIGSVKNTQKITRAMELVAASKMRKAQDRMRLSKPYSEKIRDVIGHVSESHSEYKHPYMQKREEIKRVGYIVVSTDRGLCGGLNINLFRSLLKEMQAFSGKNVEIDLCLVGRKGEAFFNTHGGNVVSSASQLGDTPSIQDLIGVIKVMLDRFDNGKIDALYLCYNEFINTMTQKPIIRELLPLQAEEMPKEEKRPAPMLGDQSTQAKYWDYIYEPDDARNLLTMLLVRYVESQVYQAVIENIACEQSARMVAMKAATENAGDIINELQLMYNKARQASITQEIAEICSGAAAVE